MRVGAQPSRLCSGAFPVPSNSLLFYGLLNHRAARGISLPSLNPHSVETVNCVGEAPPEVDPDEGKSPAAVALGRLGVAKGGKARAGNLSAARRNWSLWSFRGEKPKRRVNG